MGTFLDAALGFPAVLFSVLLLPVVLYWATVVFGVFDIDLDGAGDVDVDVDIDVGAGDGGAEGAGDGSLWHSLGLTGVPVTLAVSFIVVFGWFVALVATGAANAADLSPAARLGAGLVTVAAALVVGVLAASVVARPFARLFATTEAERNAAFVGRTCIVRTTTVTTGFGQAEASDGTGATVLLQVRVADDATEGDLRYGDEALIFDYDPAVEAFLVCPVGGLLGDPGAAPGAER